MADINQNYGDDLSLDADGDLMAVSGAEQTQQFLIRRLLTAPGTYFFEPTYGAGLSQYVGQNITQDQYAKLKSLIISQVLQEPTVAKTPVPTVTLSQPNINALDVFVTYVDAPSQTEQALSFQVTS